MASSQRFCLRWNNHQSNLLSVFDQLLHAETFTDVTLAVEGQYLKAHKMVLSACSPYFQVLFTNTPDDKHPILILKDITLADMKSLLDFMYRGEVSVDQERLTAFLRVAESLRIKGLTEVGDDSGSKSQPGAAGGASATTATTTGTGAEATVAAATAAGNNNSLLQQQQQQQPPQLHRIQPYVMQQQRKAHGMLLSNPLLGSALTQPKRKRGRPRKLSGSSAGTASGAAGGGAAAAAHEFDANSSFDASEHLVQGSPELMEMKLGADGYSDNSDDNQPQRGGDDDDDDSDNDAMDTSDLNHHQNHQQQHHQNHQQHQSNNNTSKDMHGRKEQHQQQQQSNANSASDEITPANYATYLRYGLLIPKDADHDLPMVPPLLPSTVDLLSNTPAPSSAPSAPAAHTSSPPKIRINPLTQQSLAGGANALNAPASVALDSLQQQQQQQQHQQQQQQQQQNHHHLNNNYNHSAQMQQPQLPNTNTTSNLSLHNSVSNKPAAIAEPHHAAPIRNSISIEPIVPAASCAPSTTFANNIPQSVAGLSCSATTPVSSSSSSMQSMSVNVTTTIAPKLSSPPPPPPSSSSANHNHSHNTAINSTGSATNTQHFSNVVDLTATTTTDSMLNNTSSLTLVCSTSTTNTVCTTTPTTQHMSRSQQQQQQQQQQQLKSDQSPPDLQQQQQQPQTTAPPLKNETTRTPSSGRSTRQQHAANTPSSAGGGATTPATPQQRRRVRRKANTPCDEDPAEHLTEMSVRGLDLFRYAQIFEGIYQCTECLKANVQKTFKNKYSFQRHAFLYHEGSQRKVFPCPVCGKEFSRPDKMKNHLKTTHDGYVMPRDVATAAAAAVAAQSGVQGLYPLSFLMGAGGDMPDGVGAFGSPIMQPVSGRKMSRRATAKQLKLEKLERLMMLEQQQQQQMEQQSQAAATARALMAVSDAAAAAEAVVKANAMPLPHDMDMMEDDADELDEADDGDEEDDDEDGEMMPDDEEEDEGADDDDEDDAMMASAAEPTNQQQQPQQQQQQPAAPVDEVIKLEEDDAAD